VLIFFENMPNMNSFFLSNEFQPYRNDTITIDEKNTEQAVKERIFSATRPNVITLLTKVFGRGFDFVVGDKAVLEAGGVHVIQTYISEEESEAKQTEGRTARQGKPGSYEMILNEDSLKVYGIDFHNAKKMTPMDLYNAIKT